MVSFSPAAPRLSTSIAAAPMSVSEGKTIMPEWSFPMPNSSSAQIMPCDTSPRILPSFIVNSLPSLKYNFVPMVATATFCPFATLGAPHTILRSSPVPMSTFVSESLSASGCLPHSMTCPMTTPFKSPFMPPMAVMPSTSKPSSVSNSATFSGVSLMSMYCLSQLSEIVISEI